MGQTAAASKLGSGVIVGIVAAVLAAVALVAVMVVCFRSKRSNNTSFYLDQFDAAPSQASRKSKTGCRASPSGGFVSRKSNAGGVWLAETQAPKMQAAI